MEENVEGGEQVDGNGDEDRDEETTHDGTVGWKEKWIRQLSFALARGVAGLIIRRAVGRCPPGVGWRWAGGGRVREGMGPNPDRGGAAQREGMERLTLMDRAWEDAFEETDYATRMDLVVGRRGLGGRRMSSLSRLLVERTRQARWHRGSWRAWRMCGGRQST